MIITQVKVAKNFPLKPGEVLRIHYPKSSKETRGKDWPGGCWRILSSKLLP